MNSIKPFAIFLSLVSSATFAQRNLPVFVSTWPIGVQAAEHGYNLHVNQKRSLLDAVELGISETCELRRCSNSVGAGGVVDEAGQASLDAMIMDGRTMRVGAVGNVKTVKNVISLARAVMTYTRHTFLAGDDVTQFASDMNFTVHANLTSNFTDLRHGRWISGNCQPNFRENVTPDPKTSCGPYRPLTVETLSDSEPDFNHQEALLDLIKLQEGEDPDHDTIGMLGIDAQRNLVAGVSTNGLGFKIPGRVGDSPIAGAGSYADNEAGAAASTGNGDIFLRFLPAYQAVESMRQGMSPQQAAEYAIWRMARKEPTVRGALVTLGTNGEYGGSCFGYPGFRFGVRTPQMTHANLTRRPCITLETYTTPSLPSYTQPTVKPSASSGIILKAYSYILISVVFIDLIAHK